MQINEGQILKRIFVILSFILQCTGWVYERIISKQVFREQISKEKKRRIKQIISSAFLLWTQKIIWDKGIISDEKEAQEFEKRLYAEFAKGLGFNPLNHIQGFIGYIERMDKVKGWQGESSYVGRFVCEELVGFDAVSMLKVNEIFHACLVSDFIPTLKKIWDTPESFIYSCKCGKYQGKRYKGIVCEACNTEV